MTLGEINLIEKSDKFLEFFLKSLQGFIFYDADGKLIDVNSSTLKFGLQPQEFHVFRANQIKKTIISTLMVNK